MGWGGAFLLVVLVATGIGVTAKLWFANSRTRVSGAELDNERSGDLRQSFDPNDPVCPRCHGKGLVVGMSARTCPLCGGTKHVRFGGNG